jgi:sec-independent protein translocase protein TatA
MFGNLGTPEIMLLALVVLVLFGAKKIPEFMQGLGKGVQEEIEKPEDPKKIESGSK